MQKILKISIWFIVIYIIFSNICFAASSTMGTMRTQVNDF